LFENRQQKGGVAILGLPQYYACYFCCHYHY